MHKVTAVIKTFERPDCVAKLVASIRASYPELPIIIADDSRKPKMIRGKGIACYQLPFDSGLSIGRNFLVGKVTTEYTLLLDDDYVFTPDTDVAQLVDILDTTDIDLVGGRVVHAPYGIMHFEGKLNITDTKIEVDNGVFHETNELYQVCDIVANFFLARTKALATISWDPDLKLCEHVDFFVRAHTQIKIAFCPTVKIQHTRHTTNTDYAAYRARIAEFRAIYSTKNGGRKVTTKRNTPVRKRPKRVQPKVLMPISASRRSAH